MIEENGWPRHEAVRTDSKGDWQARGNKADRLLVEVLNAVNEATSIHGEWDPIKAAVAHHTGKAVRMIGLPGGSQNPLHDGLGAHAALLQGILGRERDKPVSGCNLLCSMHVVPYSMTSTLQTHWFVCLSQYLEEGRVCNKETHEIDRVSFFKFTHGGGGKGLWQVVAGRWF